MRREMRFMGVIAGVMASLGGCSRNRQPGDGADSTLAVSLERGPCRGRCPEYRVRVYESGKVLFDGKRNVASTGAQVGAASVSDVRALMRAISEGEFASIDTAFVQGSTGCGQYYTDMPMIVLSAQVGTRLKTVQYDPGCQGAPRFLTTIAARVDSVAGTSVWIEGKGGASK